MTMRARMLAAGAAIVALAGCGEEKRPAAEPMAMLTSEGQALESGLLGLMVVRSFASGDSEIGVGLLHADGSARVLFPSSTLSPSEAVSQCSAENPTAGAALTLDCRFIDGAALRVSLTADAGGAQIIADKAGVAGRYEGAALRLAGPGALEVGDETIFISAHPVAAMSLGSVAGAPPQELLDRVEPEARLGVIQPTDGGDQTVVFPHLGLIGAANFR